LFIDSSYVTAFAADFVAAYLHNL